MVWTIQELESSDMPRPQQPRVTFKSRRTNKRWAIIGASVVLGLLLVAALLCVIMYYALPPIEICVMDCPAGMTSDPDCLTCINKCSDHKLARWGKVKDTHTHLPLGSAILRSDVMYDDVIQEVVTSSSARGVFSVCVHNKHVTVTLENYISKEVELHNGYTDILMERIVPLQWVIQPSRKTVERGNTIVLCCDATGYPQPSAIEWYKDDQLLHTYVSRRNLTIENASTEDAGLYWCSASNQLSTIHTTIAEVIVIDNTTSICNPVPQPRLIRIQSGCILEDTREDFIDLGYCPKAQCASPSTDGETCSPDAYLTGEGLCCEPISVDIISKRLLCTLRSHAAKFQVVKECGCRACSDNVVTVSGFVTSDASDQAIEYVDVVRNKRIVAISNQKGYYMVSLSFYNLADRRVVLTFSDPSGVHISLTKTIQIPSSSHHTLNIQLPKPDLTLQVNASDGGTIPIGNASSSNPFASLQLTPKSFYDAQGYEYHDVVEVTMKFIEPTEDLEPQFLPSDLMAQESNGSISALSSYGMFAIQFRSPDGRVLITSDGIQIAIGSENVGDAELEESKSKLWVLNPDTGFWELASELRRVRTEVEGADIQRSKRATETVFVGRVRITADRLWINIDQPFPMCLVKVRTFSTDSFDEHEQLSDVKVTVIAMNPPRIGNQEWRWGRIETSPSHERQGACVSTICDIANGENWGYIKASRAGQPLSPADPTKHDTGLGRAEADLDYEIVDDAIKTKLVYINSPPLYFYAQYLLCYRENFKDPHYRFYLGSQEKCQFEHTVLPEPQIALETGPIDFNYLAWYPRENPEHFYEVCYIKLALGPSYVEKGPDFSQYDEEKRALVHGGGPTLIVLESRVGSRIQGGNITVLPGDSFGSRSVCVGPDRTVCVEYKKSGMTIDQQTVIETELRGYVELSRCRLQYNKNITANFPTVRQDNQIPMTMVGSRYGVYCEKGPVLPDVKTDALRHCYAGSDVQTSSTMVPGVGVAATFCPDHCASNPCQNNAPCKNWETGFSCDCPAGFGGLICQCLDGQVC